MSKTILVTGATGQVGGAVAKQLLTHGFNVRAFTFIGSMEREFEKRKQLQQLGAEIFDGDMSSESSLIEAMKNVYGVFSVQPPALPMSEEADKHEYNLGVNVANAAKKSGVQQFVYSSVLGSERRAAYRPLFKYQIEEHIWKSDLPATIFKPSLFMETFCLPFYGLSEAKLNNAAPFDLAMPIISAGDIGVFVRLAFQKPQDFIGKSINLAGDNLTISEIADILTKKFGRQITPVQIPLDVAKQQNAIYGKIMEEYYTQGYAKVDFDELRLLHPELMTFERWTDTKAKEELQNLIG
ncbi:NmrA/HSCARG family protein [Chitinophaga filiformis]|uniref:NmrA/HSCARG family protein n=1 Tax=Chitinophaga filiformis TaxID=104663 RepID=A0ABY4HTC8_CHIFI|nr:NmrA/HSCARG family protein [Chitinophaga filiformis]UPK67025.1 NmrA/HSCARG family protein [Chitinophaga filiformis]